MNIRRAFRAHKFYSPIVDVADVAQRAGSIWPESRLDIPGVDFNDESHVHLLRDVFTVYLHEYDYPERGDETEPAGFFTRNSQFGWLDARAYFVLLRHFRPRRVIEVGAGFSTLLLDDVNRRFFDGAIDVSCIEPYPRAFLKKLDTCTLIEQKVQDVAMDTFDALDAGDILFIDSSHVSKTGSDVNFLYFEVLPRLKPGVLVHIHDIFLPQDYPRAWVIDGRRSWNEQYLVRALLMFSVAFRIVFGCNYAFLRYPDLVRSALVLDGGAAFGGGSLWIRKDR
jgi:hypothetical protein